MENGWVVKSRVRMHGVFTSPRVSVSGCGKPAKKVSKDDGGTAKGWRHRQGIQTDKGVAVDGLVPALGLLRSLISAALASVR